MTAGHEAWFVGGCVRDLLLGDAVQDVDVTTSAHPQQVEALFSRTVAVGRSFGVVVVVLPDGRQVEVATFRNDGAYIDGRRPASVTFGTAVEDVQRRDFTINALLLSPVDGTVVDHVGGLEDLHARILRMVGDADRRIAEDRLRILRGLRFAARFHLQIEAGTWRALCANTLGGLSVERIVQEWTKALSGPGLVRWLDLLATSGHLHALYPGGACPTPGARQDIARALDRLVVGSPLVVRQALWLHTTPLPLVEAWLGSLPGSRRQQEHLRWLLAQPAPEQVATWPLARRRRLFQHADCPDLLEFWRCRDGDGPVLADLRRDVEEERRQGPWTPLVRARDLIAIGCPPGPALGRVLAQTEDAQLEKLFTTAEGGLAFARTCIAATGDRQNLAGKSLPER
jgi:hypothetical protein